MSEWTVPLDKEMWRSAAHAAVEEYDIEREWGRSYTLRCLIEEHINKFAFAKWANIYWGGGAGPIRSASGLPVHIHVDVGCDPRLFAGRPDVTAGVCVFATEGLHTVTFRGWIVAADIPAAALDGQSAPTFGVAELHPMEALLSLLKSQSCSPSEAGSTVTFGPNVVPLDRR